MNVALMGSVSSSWWALDALIRSGVEVTGVLGVDESRAEHISDYRSLRELAGSAGLPYSPFVRLSEPQVEALLREHPPDLLWVIGLSQLVPARLIALARSGGVGFHPTMLPEGRGRAPVAWTILLNARAAVNLFFLADEADAGDIIVQREVPVLPDDYSEDLIERMNRTLYEVIRELAPAIRSGRLLRTPQDHSRATYYQKRTPADGLIDWTQSTDRVYRLVRAAGRPYPGAFTHHQGRRWTVWRGRPEGETRPTEVQQARCGEILDVSAREGILVRTGDGAFCMTEIEVDGRAVASQSCVLGDRLA